MYRLLLIDDEKAVLDGLLHAIAWDELGFETIDMASDGTKALEMVKRHRYHVVVSDIRMPGLDGLSLLKEISALGNGTRVIILTAYSEFEYVLQALRSGASDYLLKPIDVEQLRASVIHALETWDRTPRAAGDDKMYEEFFLSRWLKDGDSLSDLDTRAATAGVNIFLRSFNVLFIESEGGVRPQICAAVGDLLSSLGETHLLRESAGRTVMVVGGRDTDGETLRRLLLPLTEKSGYENVRVLIGTSVTYYRYVCDCYQNLCLTAGRRLPKAGVFRAEEAGELPPLPEEKASEPGESCSSAVRKTLDYIAENYASPLSLNQIADKLGMSANYLGFQFRQETGEYFSDYLNGYRIRTARELLKTTDLSVAAISEKVGYTGVNYFCQVFKKLTHQSPAAYRRSFS